MRKILLLSVCLGILLIPGVFPEKGEAGPSSSDPAILREIVKLQTPEEILDYVQKAYPGDFSAAAYSLRNARTLDSKNTAVRDAEHYMFAREAIVNEDDPVKAGVMASALAVSTPAYTAIKVAGENGVFKTLGRDVLLRGVLHLPKSLADKAWNTVADAAYARSIHIDPSRHPTSKATWSEAEWGLRGTSDGWQQRSGFKTWEGEKFVKDKPATAPAKDTEQTPQTDPDSALAANPTSGETATNPKPADKAAAKKTTKKPKSTKPATSATIAGPNDDVDAPTTATNTQDGYPEGLGEGTTSVSDPTGEGGRSETAGGDQAIVPSEQKNGDEAVVANSTETPVPDVENTTQSAPSDSGDIVQENAAAAGDTSTQSSTPESTPETTETAASSPEESASPPEASTPPQEDPPSQPSDDTPTPSTDE